MPSPWARARSAVWKFLNSGFGLWLLTSVGVAVGSYWVPTWWHQLRSEEENRLQLVKVSREILCRLNTALSQADELEAVLEVPPASSGRANIDLVTELLSADGLPARVCNISAGAAPQTLHSVLTEWQRLAPVEPFASWKEFGVKFELSALEIKTFTLLSANEDITQLTMEVRGVTAACVKPAQPGANMEEAVAKMPRCRIREFRSAVENLLDQVRRPIEAIIVQQESAWGKATWGLKRELEIIDN